MGKNIWYISKYATPLKYGFGSRHFYVASEFNRLGHKATVISSDSNHLSHPPEFTHTYTNENIDGIDTWWIKTVKYKKTASISRILSWIDFEIKLFFMPMSKLPKPDVIIASSLSLFTIINGYLLKKRYGSKLVFEIRDIWPLTMTEEGGFSCWNPFVLLLGWIEKFGYLKSDVIVGTMPNLIEHVESVISRPSDNCFCVPFGFDQKLYESPELLPEGYIEKYIPKNKFIVGYAGSIGLTNALDTLFDCIQKMKDDPNIHFLILGSGDLLNEYKSRTAGLNNVTFAPRVDKAQVQSVLAKCQILYLSVEDSKVWRYGQSLNKLVDYMYAGKPIIASYNGYPSMIDEAECGQFIPAKNISSLILAIREYAQMSREELNAIGLRGKEWLIANRTYEKIGVEFCKLF